MQGGSGSLNAHIGLHLRPPTQRGVHLEVMIRKYNFVNICRAGVVMDDESPLCHIPISDMLSQYSSILTAHARSGGDPSGIFSFE